MGLMERLANLNTISVIIIVVVLLLIRWVLLKQRNPTAKSIAEIAESLAVAIGLVFLIIRPFIIQTFFIPSESMVPTLQINDRIIVNKFIYRFKEPARRDVVVFRAPINATPDVQREIELEVMNKGLEGKAAKDYIRDESKKREKDFIKRVIGVPGDIVRIAPGYVIINHQQIGHRELESRLRIVSDNSEYTNVKLVDNKILVNGRPVSDAEVGAAFDSPNAKIKVVPGKVYVNGKALNEPYVAEDPDSPYPGGAGEEVNQRYIVVDKHGNQMVKVPKGKLFVMGDNRNNSFDSRYWGLLNRDRILGKAMLVFWPLNRMKWVH